MRKLKGTHGSPILLLKILKLEIQSYLKTLLEEVLEQRTYFVVAVNVNDVKKRIEIFLDDEEVNVPISEIAKISRWMLNKMEEDQHPSNDYVLEVSSPGIGTPLTDKRQYKKNINRYLEVKHGDQTSTGKMIDFNDDSIKMEAERPKKSNKKQMEKFEIDIAFNTIIESKVVVKF